MAGHIELFHCCCHEGKAGRQGVEVGIGHYKGDVGQSMRDLVRLVTIYRLKSAAPARQEQARSVPHLTACTISDAPGRLEVENAEDDLVQKTEVAITLMKTVLENVRTAPSNPRTFFFFDICTPA